jgi:hypothetical protein
MKMNDLDTLHDMINMIGRVRSSSASWSLSGGGAVEAGGLLSKDELRGTCRRIDSRGCASAGGMPFELGTEPIVYTRELMRDGRLSDELVERVERAAGRMAA